jgi:hypothetical protein
LAFRGSGELGYFSSTSSNPRSRKIGTSNPETLPLIDNGRKLLHIPYLLREGKAFKKSPESAGAAQYPYRFNGRA